MSHTNNLAFGDIKALITLLRIQGGSGADLITAAGQVQIVQSLVELFEQWPEVTAAESTVETYLRTIVQAKTASFGDEQPLLRLVAAYLWGVAARQHKLDPQSNWATTLLADTFSTVGRLPSFAQTAIVNQVFVRAGVNFVTILPATPGPSTLVVDYKDTVNGVLRPSEGAETIAAFEFGLFQPNRWHDVNQLATDAALWPGMASTLTDLSKGALSSDSAFPLTYLLIGLSTSTDPCERTQVAAIATAEAGTPEYPNATFANQLLYLMLMDWVDPNGRYRLPPSDVLDQTRRLVACLPNQDPGSTVLTQALADQVAKLEVSPGYPFVDGEAPDRPFDVRKSDTLFALQKAWAGLFS